ncbi:MAG TPA: NAD(P)/FAD-dependent oxidoreductase, partial [Nitrososphaeraceae archaeon]|nr:NAD(P)/FAD-dependent oxidoreductase [Nitrososphaeraceae archaeon]
MYNYDIAIVGGGPAGLSAAYTAAKAGAKVILFERDKSVGQFVRTSGVSWICEMKKLEIPEKLYNPIKNYRFVSHKNEITIKGSEYRSCVLDVRSLYQYLSFLAAKAGADISINSNVVDVLSSKNNNRISGLIVNTPKGKTEVRTRLVIDASGFNSFVGRKLGYVSTWERYGVGAEFECYCDQADPETWTLMVGSNYSPAGYAWLFPLSSNRVRIGVGIGKPESLIDPLKVLNNIIENKFKPLAELGIIQPIEYHYGYIPNQGARNCSVFEGLILVGDSAGQSNPLVLEGIRHAIEFGRLAGQIGSASLNRYCSKNSLMDYEHKWKKQLSSRIESALRVQSRWIGLTD